jgi:ComEC/Rec2-related protein
MIKTLQQAPFLRLSVFYVAGILAADWKGYFSFFFVGIFLLLSFFILLMSYKSTYNTRWLFGIGLFLFVFFTAFFLTKIEKPKSEWQEDNPREYLAEIINEPVRKPKTWLCLSQVEGKNVNLYISADSASSTLQPGDSIRFYCELQAIDLDYLRKKGVAARGFVSAAHWKKIGHRHDFSLRYRALYVRSKILKQLKQVVVVEDSYIVASALLTGYKNELTSELRRTFIATGTSHVLAVSGFHFSVIYGIIYFFLILLGNSSKARILRQAIILPIIWFYAFLTGLEPSIIRAVLMLSLWGIGEAFFLPTFTLNTLGVAALGMLLYNPYYLFDIGFQLSFSAVFSILLVNPHLVDLYQSRNPLLKYCWQSTSITISAQVGTLPICLFYFHQFPLAFVITNLFAVPLSGFLLFLLPFSLFIHQVFPGLMFLNRISDWTLHLFISGLQLMESIPNGLIDGIHFSLVDSLLMVSYFITFTLFLIKKRFFYLCVGILFVTLQVFHYFCLS